MARHDRTPDERLARLQGLVAQAPTSRPRQAPGACGVHADGRVVPDADTDAAPLAEAFVADEAFGNDLDDGFRPDDLVDVDQPFHEDPEPSTPSDAWLVRWKLLAARNEAILGDIDQAERHLDALADLVEGVLCGQPGCGLAPTRHHRTERR